MYAWMAGIAGVFTVSCIVTVLAGGVNAVALGLVSGQVVLACALASLGRFAFAQEFVRRTNRLAETVVMALVGLAVLAISAIQQARERARQRKLRWERERAMAIRRQREALERAWRPHERKWDSTVGVIAEKAVTYGVGREYVYCYTFQTTLENSRFKQEARFKIKVGMASGDPVLRIRDQVSASKTAMSEPAIVLMIFQTQNCRHLERWLHERLERAGEALGREWFLTNPAELVSLYRTYVEAHHRHGPLPRREAVAIELTDDDFFERPPRAGVL